MVVFLIHQTDQRILLEDNLHKNVQSSSGQERIRRNLQSRNSVMFHGKTIILNDSTLPKKDANLQKYYCGPGNRVQVNSSNNLNEREMQVSTKYGFSMFVDRKDNSVSRLIQNSGTWQPHYINLIGNIVNRGDYVLNLGSQSGLEALVMGKIVGPTGKVFIFEPYSFSNKLVTRNFIHNKMDGYTTIYKTGASDTKTTATIQISYDNTGGSEIIPTEIARNERYGQSQIVQIDRVDDVLPKDTKLDFALLDVEKMETKALLGMKETIKRSPNLLIMCEWQYGQNPRRNRQETMQLLNFMKDQGYSFFSYNGGNIRTCTMGIFNQFKQAEQLLSVNFMDVFFIPKGHWVLNKRE